MPTYQSIPQFEHGRPESTGILIVNLGTPDAPTATAVRRFLKQFLWDPRVVEYPRLIWWLVLNLIILRIRPARTARAYRKIWTDEGSPLLLYSRQIATRLQQVFTDRENGRIQVELAMSYGSPSIDSAVDSLLANGVRRLLVLPLYPQYSGTTTAAVSDAIARKFGQLRWIPELRFINSYYDASGYIDALANSVRSDWRKNGRGDILMMSFHGVPKSTLIKGDPYHCHCQKTARLLAAALDLNDDDWLLTFQSRVGREEWLTPYTDKTIESLGKQGLSKLDVICPGFSTDCLETLEEIEMQNAELFSAAGGGQLHYVPALNASDDHAAFLVALLDQHLSGWSPASVATHSKASREHAMAKGAVI